MHKHIILAEGKINALSLRQRVLVLLVVLMFIYYVWDSFVFTGIFGSKEKVAANAAALQQQITQLQGKITNVAKSIRIDPYKKLSDRIKDLQQENQTFEENIAKLTAKLIPAKEMSALLKGVLEQQNDLKIMHIGNIAEEPVFSEEQNVEQKALQRFQVYRHGLEIRFIGTYFASKQFFDSLQELPWKLLWDEFSYEVQDYPMASVRIVIYTLSLQKTWIGG